jgi:oligopeptide/dipeptide ABC transporter ATP-binding protein
MTTYRMLEVRDLRTYFFLSRGVLKAVDDLSFDVRKGETLGLVGESGCGKSVTCLSIMGLLPKAAKIVSGEIILNGMNLVGADKRDLQRLRGRELSMIMQDPSTSLNPLFTIGNQLGEAIQVKYGYRGERLRSSVIEWLEIMRIPGAAKRVQDYPHQISGGMKQRVAGAIALSVMPKLIIADEPTTALDVTIQAQYLLEIKKLQRELDLSTIFVTHDLGIVAAICDRVCVMYAGRIVEKANVDDFFQTQRHPYTTRLLKSLPKMEKQAGKLPMIPGEPPSLLNLPPGCSFFPRCPIGKPRCREQSPPEREISENHFVRCWEIT